MTRLSFALAVVAVCAACGGTATHAKLSENAPQRAYPAGLGTHELVAAPAPALQRAAPRSTCAPVRSLGSRRVYYAALVKRAIVVHRAPTRRSAVVYRLGTVNQNGFAQVVGVVGLHHGTGCHVDWYRIQLPVLPNGTTGWIRPWAIKTFRVKTRIVVDLSARRLSVYRSGKPLLSARVAVGAARTPTPVGRFYVDERYVLPDASGPFGPYAVGISAHSDALKDVWVQDGPIGIHGTNEPWSIGRAASHGCVRVANPVMRRLFPLMPAGTPVVVHA